MNNFTYQVWEIIANQVKSMNGGPGSVSKGIISEPIRSLQLTSDEGVLTIQTFLDMIPQDTIPFSPINESESQLKFITRIKETG